MAHADRLISVFRFPALTSVVKPPLYARPPSVVCLKMTWAELNSGAKTPLHLMVAMRSSSMRGGSTDGH